MRKVVNKTHIEGLLYQHSLELKESGPNSKKPGTKFISGNIEIATDDAMLNIVPVHFTYVTATTSTGKENATFGTLMNIINGVIGSVMKDGADKAGMVRCDSAIGLNEFYSDRSGKEELVSVKRNEGGFVHAANSLDADEKNRNTFECDIIITNVRHIDADDERGIAEKAIVKGAVFDFRNNLLPVELSVVNPNAMSYFEGLEASNNNPVFTKVRGRQISETVVTVKEEEGAFGTEVREVRSTRKDFIITWALKEPYVWDNESTITAAEMKELMAKREITLAEIKTRQDEYKASKNAINPPAAGGFNF